MNPNINLMCVHFETIFKISRTVKMTTPNVFFNVPSGAAAKVYIIDSTTRVSNMPTDFLLAPSMHQFKKIPMLGSWCFLVQSSKGQKVIFDLALSPDINSLPPVVVKQIDEVGIKFEAIKHVAEILEENGVDPAEIDSVIWRYEE